MNLTKGPLINVLLEDKRLLITGVLTRQSIAFTIARRALEEGASVTLTSFGRARRMTERSARMLGIAEEVLEFDALDANCSDGLAGQIAARDLQFDGAVHAIAYGPPGAIGGDFVEAGAQVTEQTFRGSAYSLSALARAVKPAVRPSAGAAIVALDFDATLTWPQYNWMGVAKAALEATGRYLARDLGPARIRVNLVSAGPVRTAAASAFDHLGDLIEVWERRAPLAWNSRDSGAIADTACFLLSDLSRGVTGNIVRVDGGMHLLGAGIPVTSDDVRPGGVAGPN